MFAANAIIDCILAKSADATLVACAAPAAAPFQTSESPEGQRFRDSRFKIQMYADGDHLEAGAAEHVGEGVGHGRDVLADVAAERHKEPREHDERRTVAHRAVCNGRQHCFERKVTSP